MTRVVVTGLGTTNPLGGTVPDTWAAALAGRSGAKTLDNDWAERYEIPVSFAAPAAVEPSETLEVRELRRMDRSTQFVTVAAKEAWEDAGSPEVEGERLGVVTGEHHFVGAGAQLRVDPVQQIQRPSRGGEAGDRILCDERGHHVLPQLAHLGE